MSDSLEPPAKRARLDVHPPVYSADGDAPGSPVDDMDDDFYDSTPVKPAALPGVDRGSASMFAAAATAPASFHLPGLGGSMGEAPVPQPTSQHGANNGGAATGPAGADAEGSEDGELDDAQFEDLYQEQSAVEPPAANDLQAAGASTSASHGKPSHSELPAVSLTSAKEDAAAAAAAVGDSAMAADDGEIVTEPTALATQEGGEGEDDSADELALAITNGLAEQDGKAEFLQAAEANKDNKDAEWQLDSDASSSDSSDPSSDGSSDDEGSDDGELLDPAEQIRLLMAEVADEPGAAKAKVKTLNEVEEQYEKPDINVNQDTKITELGKVESVVENLVLIKAKASGDLQVLESGSALCLQDRTVVGKISEQIGRVEDPRYSLGFNDPAEITTLGIAKDTPIYYVDDHSTFVFTEPLRAQKHTDASNLHDEEANDVEFSDDEKEAEYKREQKSKKRARQEDNNDEPKPEKPEKPIPTGPKGHVDVPSFYQPMEYQGGGLKYSDDEDEDLGMYKPLARPDHFEQIVGHGAPLEDRSHVRRGNMRGRGAWGDRGRGFRGRGGFGGRGDFGGGQNDRGGYAGGRGDFGGPRGDRGGHSGRGDQGGRGGAQGGGRNDRTCYACGQVGHQKRECPTLKPQLDRGRPQDQHDRQQDNRQRNSAQQDHQSAMSASPARHQDRGQSQQSSQPQHSPPAKSKNKNRKQRLREKKEKERQEQQQNQQQQRQQSQSQPQPQPQPQQQHQQQPQQQQHASPAPPVASNVTSYANNSSAGWPQPYSSSPQPAAAYAPPPPPVVAAPYAVPAPYVAPVPYAQPAAPAPAQGQQQNQANWAAWAQWLQVVQTMQQQQQQPQAAAAPAPPPLPPPPPPPPPSQQQQQPQVHPQAQYAYPYQQYGQNPAPPPNAGQQPGAQGQQNLTDILRLLGQGGGGQR